MVRGHFSTVSHNNLRSLDTNDVSVSFDPCKKQRKKKKRKKERGYTPSIAYLEMTKRGQLCQSDKQ